MMWKEISLVTERERLQKLLMKDDNNAVENTKFCLYIRESYKVDSSSKSLYKRLRLSYKPDIFGNVVKYIPFVEYAYDHAKRASLVEINTLGLRF